MEPNQMPIQPIVQPTTEQNFKPTKKSLPKWPLIIVGVILLATLLTGTYLLGKNQGITQKPASKTQTTTQTVAKFTPTPTPDPTANWQTYVNTKYGFSFKYPSNFKIVLPILKDYEFAPDQADMIIPEKTRDITLVSNDNKTILNILLLLNANRTIGEIKKNPTQGGGAPIKNMTDIIIDNTPAIQYEIDGQSTIQTVRSNTEYLFALEDENASNQILSTFKFTP